MNAKDAAVHIIELEKILARLAQFDDVGAAKERESIEQRIEQLKKEKRP